MRRPLPAVMSNTEPGLPPNLAPNLASPAVPDQRTCLQLRDKAYRLLGNREHSTWELRRKLASKAPGAQYPQAVEQLLAELAEQGAQSDFRFAEQHCRRRYQNGRGPVKLRHELTQHQIEKSMRELVMSDYETKWCTLAGEVRRRKFGEQPPANYREWARQARFLQQRGFDGEQIEPYTG